MSNPRRRNAVTPHVQTPQTHLSSAQVPNMRASGPPSSNAPGPGPAGASPQPARAPLPLRLAAWSWGAAGALFVIVPPAAALLLFLQYRSLMREAGRAADLFDFADRRGWIDAGEAIDAEQLREALLGIDETLRSAPLWALVLLLILYLVGAVCVLALYVTIARCTARCHQWARITGTVLAALSAVAILQLWLFFASFAWVPLNALAANDIGLAVLALHALGVVLVWLPPSNSAVRARSAARRAAAAHAVPSAPPL